MDDDVVMTMDVTMFEKSLQKVLSGFLAIETATKKGGVQQKTIATMLSEALDQMTKKTQDTSRKAVSTTTGAVAKGMVIATGAIAAIKGVVASVVQNIPELGKTFEISRDIITRNLLWPLRKELIPILQNVLSWVRDHRVAFVQAGTVIVSVFRLIKSVVLSFVDVVKNIWKHFATGLEAIFGKTTQSISDILNIVMFKISAVVIFIMSLLEPVFGWLADQVSVVAGLVTDFGTGFMSTMGDLSVNLEDFINIFKDLAKVIGLSDEGANSLGKSFKILGEILGMTVKPLIAGIATLLEGLVQGIDTFITTALWAKAKISGDKAGAAQIWKEGEQRSAQRIKQTKERWKDVGRNVLEGANQIKETWSGNEVSATGRVQSAITNNNKNTTQNVSIQVSGAQDPNATARAVADHLQKQKEKTWTAQ